MLAAFTTIIFFMGIIPGQPSEQDLSRCIEGIQEQKNRNFEKAASLYSHCIIEGNLTDLNQSLAYGRRGIVLQELGRVDLAQQSYKEAIKSADKAITLQPSAVAFHRRGYAYQKLGQYQSAIADFNKAIKMDPVSHGVYGSLAWLNATCPDETYRDGESAIRHARKANELTHWKNVIHLEALAAAYAEVGNFPEAESYQRQAISLITDKKVKSEILERLELYKAGKAYRDG